MKYCAIPKRFLPDKNFGAFNPKMVRINEEECLAIPEYKVLAFFQEIGVVRKSIRRTATDNPEVKFITSFVYKNGYGPRTHPGREVEEAEPETKYEPVTMNNYIDLCAKYSERRLKGAQLEYEKNQAEVERLQQELARALRAADEALTVSAAFDENIAKAKERYEAEFNQLMKHPDIEKIEANNLRICVYTKLIRISYKNNDYEIGKFKISIDTRVRDGGLRMHNLSTPHSERDHPHVLNGVPCLGNIKELVPSLIADSKYCQLITLCIQYLKSYTEDVSHGFRPFTNLEHWPKRS